MDPNDIKVLSNRSMASLALGQSLRALSDAEKCLELDGNWVKGYYRKGCALMALGQWNAACSAFGGGLELKPECCELVRGKICCLQCDTVIRSYLKNADVHIEGKVKGSQCTNKTREGPNVCPRLHAQKKSCNQIETCKNGECPRKAVALPPVIHPLESSCRYTTQWGEPGV